MCTPHTLCIHMYVYICMYTYSIILLIYIFPYINILYPPIILHTLLHCISIYTIYIIQYTDILYYNIHNMYTICLYIYYNYIIYIYIIVYNTVYTYNVYDIVYIYT